MTDQRESLCDQARADEARRAPSHRRGNRAEPRPPASKEEATCEQPCVRKIVFAANVAHDGFNKSAAVGVIQTHRPQHADTARVELREPDRADTARDMR